MPHNILFLVKKQCNILFCQNLGNTFFSWDSVPPLLNGLDNKIYCNVSNENATEKDEDYSNTMNHKKVLLLNSAGKSFAEI